MTKTPQTTIQPLWLASDLQLEAFAHTIVYSVKQSASEYVVQAIKKAVEYEREQCAKVVEADGLARGDEGLALIKAAGRIRARGEE